MLSGLGFAFFNHAMLSAILAQSATRFCINPPPNRLWSDRPQGRDLLNEFSDRVQIDKHVNTLSMFFEKGNYPNASTIIQETMQSSKNLNKGKESGPSLLLNG